MTDRLTNWAGNITYEAARVHQPESVAELQQVVASAARLRPLGSRHSFNRIADTRGDLVTLAGLAGEVELDTDNRAVRVGAGLRYGEVAEAIHAQGFALHNLGSLPHISVAGACATGTHGSGDGLGALPSAVRAVELVTADGDLVTLERGAAGFGGAAVSLGALGVATRVTLDVQPTFDVAQTVYDDLPLDLLRDRFEEVFSGGYSVSVFTDWRAPWRGQVWRKQRVPLAGDKTVGLDDEGWLGLRPADGPRHPVPGMSPVHCTVQGGQPGAWHHRLPHFRLEFTPSSGEELQSEWLLPRERAVEALDAVAAVREQVAAVLQIAEIRTVARDDLWLSMASGRDSAALHFTWVADTAAVLPVVELLDERLTPLGGRPHWGKVFTTPPDVLRALYPQLDTFEELRRELDPRGVFRNDLLDRYLPVS